MEKKLTSGCTCTTIINQCDFHELEKEEFMIRAYIKQMQENIITLHKRLMNIEKLLETQTIDVTSLIATSLEYYEIKT